MKKKSTQEKKPSLSAGILELETQVGNFMHYWGFKKIHGRIWLHLYVSEKPLDTAELMGRLKVSKGLMSLALRELLDYKVILPVNTGRHGTVYYQANPEIYEVITGVLRARELVMLEETAQCTERLLKFEETQLKKEGLDRARIESVMNMANSAQLLLHAFLTLGHPHEGALFDHLKIENS